MHTMNRHGWPLLMTILVWWQYYVDDYSEELLMEVGSTTSNGSTSSNRSSIPDIKLGLTVASTVYFA